ncbi:MAG: serine hydrolase domain-containing protein, partial [Glaciecola sp.]
MKLNDYVMIHMCILLLFGALVFPQAAMANKNNNEIALNELHKSIEATLKQHEIPAFAYAIVSQGKRPVVEVFGQHASFGHTNTSSTPITINTPFRLASVSKLIVGIAVMQHIERGTLSLDDRLDNLLPWLIYKNSYKDTHPILLKHLLEHTTGWDETSLKERAAGNKGSLSIQDILSISADSRESRWQPGTRHAYTNTTATVVAAIIEEVSGQSFYDYVASEIFMPLQIGSATYNESNVQMPLGHRGKRSVPYQHIVMAPSGALAMSIVDMAKLANEFVAEHSRLLHSSSLTRMTLSTTTNAGNFKAGYGIFNYARYYNGIPYRGHDGALPGWLAEFSYSPNNKVGFVVMQNSENGRA